MAELADSDGLLPLKPHPVEQGRESGHKGPGIDRLLTPSFPKVRRIAMDAVATYGAPWGKDGREIPSSAACFRYEHLPEGLVVVLAS